MARQSANTLKAKKQINEYVAQKNYRHMQVRNNFYNVYDGKKLVAANLTMEQTVRQFHPITQFTLVPV